MVIGFSFREHLSSRRIVLRRNSLGLGLLLGWALGWALPIATRADETIIQKNGTRITGQITGVTDGRVTVKARTANGGMATVPYLLADIRSVEMAAPAGLANAAAQAPAAAIATLEPLVRQYAGLPAPWVLDAMGQLADAYSATGRGDAAAGIYSQIAQLYPGSPYTNIAVAGNAQILLSKGQVDQALAAVRPVIDAANKNVAPSPEEGRAYAHAFLVYGQILQAQKKFPEALEAFLTVKTMFYQNPALVAQAGQRVDSLRAQNPDVSVN